MTLGSDRVTTAVAIFIATLAAALGADVRMAHAAGTPASKGAIHSLTTQFPLGRQKLCCSSKPRRHATKPARPPSTASQTTSVTSSTAAAAPPPRSRTVTTSQPPLLGRRDGSAMAPLIVIALVILGGAAAVLIGRLSVRRRRRARRMARTGPAAPGASPAVSRTDAALRSDSVPGADVVPRPEEASPPPVPIEWKRVQSRTRSRAPLEPDLQPPPAVAVATGSDGAEEHMIADPLAQLEREILEQGGAAPAALRSRQSQPGQGAYRLGQVLYKRGRLDEAAAAWRLAASKQHPEAESRLAELLEETGDTDARS